MAAERVIKPEEGQKLAKVRDPYSTLNASLFFLSLYKRRRNYLKSAFCFTRLTSVIDL